MKILKFTAENFKKLSAVEISPDGNVVLITGKNGAGKSSVLDGIEAALTGGRNLPKQPIKAGEHRAKLEVDMGEYKVTRKFLGTTSTLKVETTGENKSKVSSPQAFLDKIVGDISFDPLAFMKKTPAEQRNSLMAFLGLNLDEFDNKVATLKAERSSVRKSKEQSLHAADSITSTPGLPPEELVADPLLAELDAIRRHNEKCQKIETENAVQSSRLDGINKDIDAARRAINDWTSRLSVLQTQKLALESAIVSSTELKKIDPAEVEAKIKALGETNGYIRNNNQKKAAMVDYEIHCSAYRDLGDAVKQTEAQKARKMAETPMPVPGLTIQSDGLAFNGIPLEQECDSKKLKICVAISMAMNPELKVLRISGNDLDHDSLVTIGELVAEKDYQVWVEKVSDDNTLGFFIEDGHLANQEETLGKFTSAVKPLLDKGLPDAVAAGLPEIHEPISKQETTDGKETN